VAIGVCLAAVASAETNWEIQAVNEQGLGTHPKVGADPSDPANRVTIRGIALNATQELLDSAKMWQIYIQGEGDDLGGTAAFSAIFFQQGMPWPQYPMDIQPGDRIEVTGFIANHLGKININERHSPDPSMDFVVTVLERGVGMPAPEIIPNVASCIGFDPTRTTGGERYQARWVRVRGVRIVSGTWAGGQHVWVSDDGGASQLPILLAAPADWSGTLPPLGPMDVTGIFDQEAGLGAWPPPNPPYTSGYRIWVKNPQGITPWTAAGDGDGDGDVDVNDFAGFQACFNGPGRPAAAPGCGVFDFDEDDDVDVNDFARFQGCFNGSGYPAPDGCYRAP